jgi:hypothetical protein
MYELYKKDALAGTCLWYWAEINDYNRGGAACVDGTLKEALVDFDRKPNLIYDAFCNTLKKMDENATPCETYEAFVFDRASKMPLKCTEKPSYDKLLSVARMPLKTHLAKTRKKKIDVGPILQREEISGISKIPYLVTENPLVFSCTSSTDCISVLGMTSLNYGYPILGKYGEDVAQISIQYADGKTQNYIAKNGIDVTVAYTSVGSSKINPVAENAKKAIIFSYDKNFEEYVINNLEIKVEKKPISKIEIKSLNPSYHIMIYGVFI